MITAKLNRRNILFITFFLLYVFLLCVGGKYLALLLSPLMLGMVCYSCIDGYRKKDRKAVSISLVFPLILTVMQNLYLGLASPRLNISSVTISLSLNIFYVWTMLFVFALEDVKGVNKGNFGILVCLVVIYSIFLYFINPTALTAYMASMRNLIGCFSIYLFVNVLSPACDRKKLFSIILFLIWFVVLFGLLEFVSGFDLWNKISIGDLWDKKGIGTNESGIPANWYSSEFINGAQFRRMVSSFADPVNLGSFLFAALMFAWYLKRWILSALILLCCALTVSKGALLSILIAAVVYFCYSKKLRFAVPIVLTGVVTAGLMFYRWNYTHSTGSMQYHIDSFLSILSFWKQNPAGVGVGNAGNWSYIAMGNLNGPMETGVGSIIAQTGLVGALAYIFFFAKLFKDATRWKRDMYTNRARVLYYSLMFGWMANICFNDVALSINSSYLYFLLLAYLPYEADAKNENAGNYRKFVCFNINGWHVGWRRRRS